MEKEFEAQDIPRIMPPQSQDMTECLPTDSD